MSEWGVSRADPGDIIGPADRSDDPLGGTSLGPGGPGASGPRPRLGLKSGPTRPRLPSDAGTEVKGTSRVMIPHATGLGRPVGELIGPNLLRQVEDAIARPWLDRRPAFLAKGPLRADGGRRMFDAALHRSGGVLILELEPTLIDDATDFRDLAGRRRRKPRRRPAGRPGLARLDRR